MHSTLMANIGSWIGRGLANGEPMAVVGLIVVPTVFYVTYRLMAWWQMQ